MFLNSFEVQAVHLDLCDDIFMCVCVGVCVSIISTRLKKTIKLMCVINFKLTDSQRMYDAFVKILYKKPRCFLTYQSSIHDLHERYSNWLDSH